MARVNLQEIISEMGADAFHRDRRLHECPFRYGGRWAKVWKESWVAEKERTQEDRLARESTGVRIIRGRSRRKEQA